MLQGKDVCKSETVVINVIHVHQEEDETNTTTRSKSLDNYQTNNSTRNTDDYRETNDSTAKSSKSEIEMSRNRSKEPVESVVDASQIHKKYITKKKLKKRTNKRQLQKEQHQNICNIIENSLNEVDSGYCICEKQKHCRKYRKCDKGFEVCDGLVRRKKWLIADIANYLTKRLQVFLKHESYVLSNSLEKYE